MIISFSGIDNSGKSTQIDLLIKELSNRHKSAIYIWSRGGYTPFYNFLKRLLRKGLKKRFPPAGLNNERESAFRNPLVQKMWLAIAIFDLTLFYGLYFRFVKLMGKTIIADRYINDTEIDFILNFPAIPFQHWLIWKILLFIIPRPEVNLLLTIPLEESKRRSIVKKEPFADNDEQRKKRYDLYMQLKIKNRHSIIDATQPIEIVFYKIKKTVFCK